jgi:hypothetical protein
MALNVPVEEPSTASEAGVGGHREKHSKMRKLGDRQGCFAARQHQVELFFYGVAGKLGWCGPMTLGV